MRMTMRGPMARVAPRNEPGAPCFRSSGRFGSARELPTHTGVAPPGGARHLSVIYVDNSSAVHQPSTRLSAPVTSSRLQSTETPVETGLT